MKATAQYFPARGGGEKEMRSNGDQNSTEVGEKRAGNRISKMVGSERNS